ncbi:epimerase family protein SDR39U1 homolog, chloroplastic isoform X2 [Cryptomeria japonica]|uniref:epimerase family protein SDR39U1 homolog, chloroplastic isoform X2 n=1 Tax=Cryptomeria japonica TaxID=3369 RepID=UPI0025ACAD1B|nr:epimerase family protein SDR39U1 homolog, chloroplastic isoform X2 [Cryptomeria japonica]
MSMAIALPMPMRTRPGLLVRVSAQHSMTNETIVSITGATGFIGRRLVQKLLSDNHKIQILTRSKSKAQQIFPGKKIKADIKNSRVSVTSKVVDAINTTNVQNRPSVFISATAVGYYGTSEIKTFDETSSSGYDYLSEVCREWEAMAQRVNDPARLVLLRIGVVLDKDGGALAKMIPLFFLFAGGPIGSGKQWFSWIHRDDLVNLIIEAISNPAYKGVINGTAPNPVRLAEMCNSLGNIMGRPSWLPVPEFAVKTILGEGAAVVLDGQRVMPKKALELGFKFKYHHINDALKAIISS